MSTFVLFSQEYFVVSLLAVSLLVERDRVKKKKSINQILA